MENFSSIFVVSVLVVSLLFWFYNSKKSRAKNEAIRPKKEAEFQKWYINMALEQACKEGDIDKMIELLEKGGDPNQRIKVWSCEYDDVDSSVPPRALAYYKIKTLLDITYNPAAEKLLRAYGAKTIDEISAENEPIEKAREEERIAEEKRQKSIREAEEKAKKEAEMRKVEAFLASKGKKA